MSSDLFAVNATSPVRSSGELLTGMAPIVQWVCGPCGLDSEFYATSAETQQLAGVHDGLLHGGRQTADVVTSTSLWEEYFARDLANDQADDCADDLADDDADGWS